MVLIVVFLGVSIFCFYLCFLFVFFPFFNFFFLFINIPTKMGPRSPKKVIPTKMGRPRVAHTPFSPEHRGAAQSSPHRPTPLGIWPDHRISYPGPPPPPGPSMFTKPFDYVNSVFREKGFLLLCFFLCFNFLLLFMFSVSSLFFFSSFPFFFFL